MKITVVSTFPLSHDEIYGRRFLEECARYSIPLILVHYENFSFVPSHGEKRIEAIRGKPGFDLAQYDWHRKTAGLSNTAHYRWQVQRFAWKAFAMTRKDVRKDADFLVWLDADVRITGDPNWGELLSVDHDVSYLGRKEWDHSETGFLGWNLRRRGGEGLDCLRDYYVSGRVMAEPQWHDAWIFDRVRESLGLQGLNLSPNAKGLDAWTASPLARWSDHLKGNRKFHVPDAKRIG